MSQTNVEIVRAIQPPPEVDLADLFMRDAPDDVVADALQALSETYSDDFVCVFHRATDEPRRGLAGLREAWLDWLEPWDSYRAVVDKVAAIDDSRVMVVSRDFARRADMADEVLMHGVAVWTVRDGKIARAEFFAQREDARAAGIELPE